MTESDMICWDSFLRS